MIADATNPGDGPAALAVTAVSRGSCRLAAGTFGAYRDPRRPRQWMVSGLDSAWGWELLAEFDLLLARFDTRREALQALNVALEFDRRIRPLPSGAPVAVRRVTGIGWETVGLPYALFCRADRFGRGWQIARAPERLPSQIAGQVFGTLREARAVFGGWLDAQSL